MINEERLQHRIRLSQFDENDGKSCKPMTQYARKDYVALQMLISFVTGTLSYALLFGLWALQSVDELFAWINTMEIQTLVMIFVLTYLAFLVFYLGVTYIVFHVKYTEGRKKVKKYYASLKKVNQMYEREDRLRMDRAEWE